MSALKSGNTFIANKEHVSANYKQLDVHGPSQRMLLMACGTFVQQRMFCRYSVIAPKPWNSLPAKIRNLKSLDSFKADQLDS